MNNIITSLLLFINNAEVQDTNYLIAYGLLKYGEEIENMTLVELAEKCYVSVSAINRFIKIFGYHKYQMFKTLYVKHFIIRKKQMKERIDNKNEEQLHKYLLLLNQCGFCFEDNKEMITKICQKIYQSKRIVLIGSDEMVGHTLRLQGDFCTMGKMVVKDSVFKNNYFVPHDDDFVILLSMNGKVIGLNPYIKDNLEKQNKNVLTIGQSNYLQSLYLSVPKNIDEVFENMIVDIYLQNIVYTYMRDYYEY